MKSPEKHKSFTRNAPRRKVTSRARAASMNLQLEETDKENIYTYGTKKVEVKMIDGVTHVRDGDGYVDLETFSKQYHNEIKSPESRQATSTFSGFTELAKSPKPVLKPSDLETKKAGLKNVTPKIHPGKIQPKHLKKGKNSLKLTAKVTDLPTDNPVKVKDLRKEKEKLNKTAKPTNRDSQFKAKELKKGKSKLNKTAKPKKRESKVNPKDLAKGYDDLNKTVKVKRRGSKARIKPTELKAAKGALSPSGTPNRTVTVGKSKKTPKDSKKEGKKNRERKTKDPSKKKNGKGTSHKRRSSKVKTGEKGRTGKSSPTSRKGSKNVKSSSSKRK